MAALGAASGTSQTVAVSGNPSSINLRFYQLNFFGQDEWRIRNNLSLSAGLRYEYNTPPRELNRRIESTFNSPLLDQVPNLGRFIEGRTQIFDPDRNNFAPRVGIAYSPAPFGRNRATVIRAGYGLFYDQILGAVVSQSRSVYPNFLTVNFTGGFAGLYSGSPINIVSPAFPNGDTDAVFIQPGTLNTLRPGLTLNDLINQLNMAFDVRPGDTRSRFIPQAVDNFLSFTLASKRLEVPLAHHYNVAFEQQLSRDIAVSAAYVGTLGRHLLRFNTPNLGPNAFPVVEFFQLVPSPSINGTALPPGTRFSPESRVTGFGSGFSNLLGGRPVSGVGTVFRFETTASSRYDALQLQLRGRLRRSLQYQASYTSSKATDDVSDVFDLAGASALPQNSLTFAGERGPANFDVRHRFTYNFSYDLPDFRERGNVYRLLFGGLQLAGTGRLQTGQPFTVNTVYDVNLDGNNTDRLNTTQGVIVTGDRRQPLRLTTEAATNTFSLLAPVGEDGDIERNTFRAGSVVELDLAIVKNFNFTNSQRLIFRTDIFNFINRANFGVPVRLLEAPGFGRATETVTPGRRIQFALKYSF